MKQRRYRVFVSFSLKDGSPRAVVHNVPADNRDEAAFLVRAFFEKYNHVFVNLETVRIGRIEEVPTKGRKNK
jgi:hypothetical protein